jgi:FMN hydrolase / 5-amino-6-(5-phospho-D-ribitylamino)uracil phosphatase
MRTTVWGRTSGIVLFALERIGLSLVHRHAGRIRHHQQQQFDNNIIITNTAVKGRHKLNHRQSYSRCFLQLELVENEEEEVDNSIESLTRWERMYQEGEVAKQETFMSNLISSADSNDKMRIIQQQQQQQDPIKVRVVTFDLDNTVWKTSGTIDAANNVLADHLQAHNITTPRRIEKVMGDLFQSNRKRYCPLCEESSDDHKECCTAPVLLTQLRTDAIRHVLETENGVANADQAQDFAQEAFEVWTQARHDAILDNLVPQALETLDSIRNNLDGTVLIGAITDGNSNPSRVEALQPYFDFCINAESVGVAKPNKLVYLQAVRTIASHQAFSQVLPADIGDVTTANDVERLEEIVGPYWVHIGDDFFKDIVAAKNMKMRTIWAIELVRDKLLVTQNITTTEKSPTSQPMDMQDFLNTVSSQSVVSLGIGADDYLASSLTGEFVDAVAESFSDIGRILSEWHTMCGKDDDTLLTSKPLQDTPTTTTSTIINNNSFSNLVPPFAAITNDKTGRGVDFVIPRVFRLVRDDYTMDVPAPLKNRSDRTMRDVMSMAQIDKSSGVFAFSVDDADAFLAGTKTLVIQIGGTDIQFSKDIFSAMSVEEVLSMTDENPVTLSLSLKEAVTDGQTLALF